jgi:predicted MFS family arabinose efflux permease
MQVPVRLLRAVRPSEHPGLLLATAYGTAVLSVAPFLLPALADEYGIGLGLASTATAAQLGGFVAGSWGSGRLLLPRGRVLGVALLVALVANGASALLPPFALLIVLRVVSGLALGVITWYSWSQVFGDDHRMSEIAVIGPLVGITTAPVAAGLIDRFGPEGIFAALAITAVVPLAFSRRSGRLQPQILAARAPQADTGRHAPTRDAKRILACLGLMTLGGSSVFTLGAVIATERAGLSLSAISLAYSANAVASIPSARWTGGRGVPGLWVLGCGAAAVIMGTVPSGVAFFCAISFWGFAFWMGVPGAFSLLSARSQHPTERAGDAQAVMAAGRVVGPLIGGVVLDATSAAALGLAGGGLLGLAGLGLVLVEKREAT